MRTPVIKSLYLKDFTAFDEIEIAFSPGINIFIGPNGTGKTHILKLLYSIVSAFKEGSDWDYLREKLVRVFLPYENNLGRLVRNQKMVGSRIKLDFCIGHLRIGHFSFAITKLGQLLPEPLLLRYTNSGKGIASLIYIPPREILANAPGFRSLYKEREINFEEVYPDLLDKVYLPSLKENKHSKFEQLLTIIEEAIEGKVTSKDEYLFLKTDRHSVEFTLLAEGFRKLALIWLLIKNGSLSPGAILFWDEPESSLNPSLLKKLIEIILGIGRQGVQVFIATHNYIVLKEFDIQATDADRINYHSLYREKKTKPIECNTSDKFSEIHPNVILDVFTDIYDREIDRVLKGDK